MTPRAHMVPISGSYRAAVPQARLIGKSNPSEQIQVSIYARQNPGSYGTTRTLEQSSLEVPGKKYMTGSEFNQEFGADPEDLTRITAWARANKLKVLDTSASTRRVLVEGSIADIDAAFGVELNEYDHPESGRYRGREGEIHVPAELDGIVEGVFGLDNRRVGRPRNRRSRALPAPWQDLQRPKQAHEARKGTTAALAAPSSPWAGTFFPSTGCEYLQLPSKYGRERPEYWHLCL